MWKNSKHSHYGPNVISVVTLLCCIWKRKQQKRPITMSLESDRWKCLKNILSIKAGCALDWCMRIKSICWDLSRRLHVRGFSRCWRNLLRIIGLSKGEYNSLGRSKCWQTARNHNKNKFLTICLPFPNNHHQPVNNFPIQFNTCQFQSKINSDHLKPHSR